MSDMRCAGEAPEMTPPQAEQFYASVRRQLVRMLDLLNKGAPDFIMTGEVSILWWRYMGKCPQGMIQGWVDDLITEAMRRQARCDLCGVDIAPAITHVPNCERCDAELDAMTPDELKN